MATMIAILSEFPEPQQGEQVCLLRLSFQEGLGYRVSALAPPSNRAVGRWVSDCPLTACQSALLWVTTQPWTVQIAHDSLDVNQVIATVPSPSPMEMPGVHPRDVVSLLMNNLPPKHPTNAATGATLMLGGPAAAPAPVPVQQRPSPQAPAAPIPTAPQVAPGDEQKEAAKELAVFMRGMIHALRDGHDPDTVRQAIVDQLGFSVDPSDYDGGDEHELEDDDPELTALLEEDDSDLLLAEEPEPSRRSPAEMPRKPLEDEASSEPVTTLRPLLPGEPLPGHLSEEARAQLAAWGDDGSARAKLERTMERRERQAASIRANMLAAGLDPDEPWQLQLARQEAEAAAPAAGEAAEQEVMTPTPAISAAAPPLALAPTVENEAPSNGRTNGVGRALTPEQFEHLKAEASAESERAAAAAKAKSTTSSEAEAEPESSVSVGVRRAVSGPIKVS